MQLIGRKSASIIWALDNNGDGKNCNESISSMIREEETYGKTKENLTEYMAPRKDDTFNGRKRDN